MSALSAQHYLRIYRTRLSMAERGMTSTRPEIVSGMRRFVAALSALAPDATVQLEIHGQRTRFIAAATGELLGEFTNDA